MSRCKANSLKRDIDAVIDVNLRMSALGVNYPALAVLDINPLIVYAESKEASVADSRIMLRKPGAAPKPSAGH